MIRNAPRRTNRGMTLFELSVVVIIAVILAGLAIYSTQSVVTRTKVSRAQEDQRALSRAIQNYIMDYASLPSTRQGLTSLTQPTVYLGSVPRDPFQKGGTYLYLNPNSREIASIVISPGPDGDFDLPPELWSFAASADVDRALLPLTKASRMVVSAGADPLQDPDLTPSANENYELNEMENAVLSTYLRLGRYDPAKGPDGDIISVIRY